MTARRLLRRAAPVVVAAMLAAGMAGCGVIGGGGDQYGVTIYFARAVALYEQGQVRVLGLPAGHVDEVATEGNRVRVEISVDSDIPVPQDVKAALVPQSLIGERYVQLTPAWIEGQPRLQDLPEDERVIDVADTVIPVEPDEALAALNEFLQSLDPDSLGRLITNSADDLEGNGENLGIALDSVSDLVNVLAEHDDELASIVENFDEFTSTLVTRESQIGEVLDAFARTANLLADERANIEALVGGLARVSQDGFDLISEHAASLRTDVDTLGRLSQSIVANLDAVEALLDAGPRLADGLIGAYNPTLRAMNLRTQLTPLTTNLINILLRYLTGDPDATLPCLPVLVACDDAAATVAGASGSEPVLASSMNAPRTPIDDVLDLLAAPSAPPQPTPPAPGIGERVVDGTGAVGRFLRGAAETLVGIGS